MELLKRKIDEFLSEWKQNPDRLPLIVKGARQVGKTASIRQFGESNYTNVVEINFLLQKQYCDIFDDGFETDTIIRNITLHNPELEFIPGETLIFFDELQACINCATSLKSFKQDGRYDVICSGSLMGINYNEIESNSVGYKEDYEMYSLDFEEFLWAKGYKKEQIEELYQSMAEVRPFSSVILDVMFENFREYMVLGGMPAVVRSFVQKKNYSGTLSLQRQILLDYEEDITKYAGGLDHGKILNVYRKVPVFLGKENKKFQISKVERGARNREYIGVLDWLNNAGIVNICYCMEQLELPLKGNYNPDNYKVYFRDTGLLVGSLDEEAQEDLTNWTKDGHIIYFIQHDETVVGFAHLGSRGGKTDWLEELFILPEYQGSGFGSEAIHQLEEIVKQYSVSLYIEAAARNEAAIRLYRKLGYDCLNTITIRKDFPGYEYDVVRKEKIHELEFEIRKDKAL